MDGYIDEYGQARVNVAVSGGKMQISVNPVIDTGFDGDLCLLSYLEIDFERKEVRIE